MVAGNVRPCLRRGCCSKQRFVAAGSCMPHNKGSSSMDDHIHHIDVVDVLIAGVDHLV